MRGRGRKRSTTKQMLKKHSGKVKVLFILAFHLNLSDVPPPNKLLGLFDGGYLFQSSKPLTGVTYWHRDRPGLKKPYYYRAFCQITLHL